ncbi:MAG: alpha/beta hydrolase family protein [Armatimonadota bacterium]
MTATQMDWKVANVSRGKAFEPLAALNRWWGEITPRVPFSANSVQAFSGWQVELRDALQEQLGWTPDALPLQPRTLAEGEWEPGINFRYGEVETAPGMTVPFMLLVPQALTAPGPAVLCVHGHGGGMNPLFGLDEAGNPVEEEYQHAFALEACRRGFVTLSFDMLCFGRRRDFDFCSKFNAFACITPTEYAYQIGSSMVALRVFDARQMLTLLGMQPEVDAERIGMSGISGGGTITFFTTVLDDRVRAAMISGYFNKFAAYMQVFHCIDNFVPGLAHIAEMPDMGCAIAPRPLLVSQGTRDPIFPIDATRAGVEQLRTAYRLFEAEDRLEEEYYDAEHVFSNARVWDFMGQWL